MRNFSFFISIICFLSIIFLTSCEPDEIEVSEDLGNIDLVITENLESNALTLSLANPNEKNINKVAFYLNDKLIGEINKAPFVFDWEIKNYTASELNFRSVVSGESEKASESSRRYEPSENLLEIEVDQNYYNEADQKLDEWVMISDVRGNLVDIQRVEDGQNLIIKRPEGFFDPVFHVTNIIVIGIPGQEQSYFKTFLYLKPDKWKYKAYEYMPYHGTLGYSVDFSIDNIPRTLERQNYSFINSGISFRTFSNWVPYQLDFSAYTQVHSQGDYYFHAKDMYLSLLSDGEGVYKIFYDLKEDDEIVLDYNDLTPLKMHSINFDESTYTFISNRGYKEIDGEYRFFTTELDHGPHIGDTHVIGYPENYFDYFEYTLSIYKGDIGYLESSIGNIPAELRYPDYNYNLDFKNVHQLKYTANADFDYFEIRYGNSDRSNFWTMYGNVGSNIRVLLPELPDLIVSRYPSINTAELNFTVAYLNDYESLDGYDDYLQTTLRDGIELPSNRYRQMSFYDELETGRLNTTSTTPEYIINLIKNLR